MGRRGCKDRQPGQLKGGQRHAAVRGEHSRLQGGRWAAAVAAPRRRLATGQEGQVAGASSCIQQAGRACCCGWHALTRPPSCWQACRYAKMKSSDGKEVIGWENIELISDRCVPCCCRSGPSRLPRASPPAATGQPPGCHGPAPRLPRARCYRTPLQLRCMPPLHCTPVPLPFPTRPLEVMLKEFKQLKAEFPDRILIASIMEEFNKAAVRAWWGWGGGSWWRGCWRCPTWAGWVAPWAAA